MKQHEFIDAIQQAVLTASANDTVTILEKPPGKRPQPELLALSNWFQQLSAEDKQMVHNVAMMASRNAVFGFLAVLDGARQVEASEAKGRFELWFDKQGQRTLLNGPDATPLHEMLDSSIQ
ncbi:MAG TPA: hypothetical protein VLS89_00340 [Candidatus Nanopelagicales bacterium]|nr:hypothetical protein [Candidatus Nanopelagicales bacterium]